VRARKSLAAALIGRRWNAATVGEVSTAWRGSDTSPAAFARAHGIGVWRLGWWRKRLDAGAGGRNGRTTQLAPLTFLPVTAKAWMFYGSDTHAEAAAAIFSVIASCRLHWLDPFVYLDEILRILPYWPNDRYLELAPKNWLATRARLRPEELEVPRPANCC
jgi:hypothetical protein